MSKLKIVLHSNHSRAKTGFGKHMRHLLMYLHKTGKYEVVEFCNGLRWDEPKLKNMPWKCIGSLPFENNLIQEINNNPSKHRGAGYGHYKIDDLIRQEKPDIYLGIEDIWGVEGFWNKLWWNKLNSLIWTPVDSLPLLDKHINAATFTKDIIVQASFAKKALNEKGFNNVHLLPVPIDTDSFYKLPKDKKSELRSTHNIDNDAFIIGFVFRNQLRKSVPNLLDGFKLFKEKNPSSNAKLLLHTNWFEGWDIRKFILEKQINPNDILTTYFCKNCKKYEIKAFQGKDLDCRFCGSKKTQNNVSTTNGVSDAQLNEIYNLMDVYCHPFTSGGQEIPIQEAKLTELITLVTDYSCGEDYCTSESGGLPLEWSEYREQGTQFIKASTTPSHIASQLSEVYNMTPKQKSKMGKKAKDFVVNFCSIESVCSKFESIISEVPKTSWNFDFSYVPKNLDYKPKDIEDPKEYILDLYKNILYANDIKRINPKEIAHFEKLFKEENGKSKIYQSILGAAKKEDAKNTKVNFSELLDKDDEGRRILFIMPGSDVDVFNSTSLLKYIKDKHPNHNIYFATQKEFLPILDGNPHVHKSVIYDSIMENFMWSEGQGSNSGMFEFCIMPHINTHKSINYIHGQKHNIEYDLNYA